MLLIDETTKIIFLHNPACGGTTIKQRYAAAHPDFPPTMLYGFDNAESNLDETYINAHVLPRFVPNYKSYKLLTFVRNPYDRFVAASRIAMKLDPQLWRLWNRNGNDPQKVCRELLSYDFAAQDQMLRNPRRPWLMPQSLFTCNGTHTLRYESASDWHYLSRVLNLGTAGPAIEEAIPLDDGTKAMIRELYFEDGEIFRMY